jgi:hypothetical protein
MPRATRVAREGEGLEPRSGPRPVRSQRWGGGMGLRCGGAGSGGGSGSGRGSGSGTGTGTGTGTTLVGGRWWFGSWFGVGFGVGGWLVEGRDHGDGDNEGDGASELLALLGFELAGARVLSDDCRQNEPEPAVLQTGDGAGDLHGALAVELTIDQLGDQGLDGLRGRARLGCLPVEGEIRRRRSFFRGWAEQAERSCEQEAHSALRLAGVRSRTPFGALWRPRAAPCPLVARPLLPLVPHADGAAEDPYKRGRRRTGQ